MLLQCCSNVADVGTALPQRWVYVNIWILLYVAFCTIMAISRQKEAGSRYYALLLFRMTSRVLYSAQYHRQHCTLHAFEQFGTLFVHSPCLWTVWSTVMHSHSHDDKYPSRPGFEPGTLMWQAPVDTNEPLGPATLGLYFVCLRWCHLNSIFLNAASITCPSSTAARLPPVEMEQPCLVKRAIKAHLTKQGCFISRGGFMLLCLQIPFSHAPHRVFWIKFMGVIIVGYIIKSTIYIHLGMGIASLSHSKMNGNKSN